MTGRTLLVIAGISGVIMVGMGALGAHLLQDFFDPGELGTWKTAVLYQMIHTLAIFGLGIFLGIIRNAPKMFAHAGISFLIGIVLFSGSLYLLAATGLSWLGWVTPVGGVLLMIGWLQLAIAALRRNRSAS